VRGHPYRTAEQRPRKPVHWEHWRGRSWWAIAAAVIVVASGPLWLFGVSIEGALTADACLALLAVWLDEK